MEKIEGHQNTIQEKHFDLAERISTFSIKTLPVQIVALFALFLFISFLYSPSLNGPFIFDDKTSIEYDKNLHLKTLDYASVNRLLNSLSPPKVRAENHLCPQLLF